MKCSIGAGKVAMRCDDLSQCTGAILGKALELLEKETGVIMVQVTLR